MLRSSAHVPEKSGFSPSVAGAACRNATHAHTAHTTEIHAPRFSELVCKAINQIVDAELVRLVGVVERSQAAAGPLPVLRDVGVVVDDHHQAPRRIVVLVKTSKLRLASDV